MASGIANPMSKARTRAILRYCERLLKALYLSHWTIRLVPEHPDSEAWASVEPVGARYVATLRVSPDTFLEPPERVRVIFVHEMLHVARARSMMAVLNNDYKDDLGQAAYDTFISTYKTELEYEVDLLSEAIAKHLPLPPRWPK